VKHELRDADAPGKGRGGEVDLLRELRELAALRLEGEDGPVDVRDLGLLHEDVPHPVATAGGEVAWRGAAAKSS
jgi:hypothetical protein